jgi:hypothetical protein
VPSSTFSSEPRRIPGGDWRAIWLVALALAIGLVAALERVTRAHGQRPSVVDDPVSWAVVRRTADDDPRVVAFVGASRMALGYSADAFAEAAPGLRGVQLAIDGAAAFGVLADLAHDERFRGLAVVDMLEWEVGVPDAFNDARLYVHRAHALWRAPGALANRTLAGLAQSELAVLALGGRRLVTSLAGPGRWPVPSWVAADRDRISRADYSLAEPAALQRKIDNRLAGIPEATPSPDEWLAMVARDLEPLFVEIRAHGGDVAVLHMPLSGQLIQLFDRKYPRQRYWDAFAARSAAHVMHFRDIPAMAALPCGDEMHLDHRDQAAFTRALVGALRERHLLRER